MGNRQKFLFTFMQMLCLSSFFIGYTNCQKGVPRLEILPVQSVQRKPVGKSLMLTCRPDVPDANLVTDLQWIDNRNMTVLPKPSGQQPPPMYTETLPGDQSLALLIPSLTESMGGTYYCTASYTNTQTLQISVRIETYVAITWKNAPENQNPTLGQDYTVRCEVTASPSATVDWLRNGDPIKTGGRYVVETHGLFIRNVQESDDGEYTCRAAVIQTGELVERNIKVEVYIKPVIEPMPASLEAVEGQSFSTFCNATGKPVPEFEWIRDQTQQNVATADRFLVNPQTGQLTITKVQQEDHGSYTCFARNDAGKTSARTKLNVLVTPKITELINITIPETREGALTCRSTGRPAPEITFRRWGSEEEFVPGVQPDDDRIRLEQYNDNERGESTGTLRISKMIRSDDGLYQCVARNKGDTAYKTGHITVEFAPSFESIKDLPPVFSWEGRVANLSCLAQSIPNATIEWRWNGRPIKEQYDKYLVIEDFGPRSDLIITPVDRKYYSVYKCIATNVHGSLEHDMELREAKKPDYIVSATPRVVTATTMTFDIMGPVFERGLPITAYSVQYKEEYNPDWSTAQNRSWSPDSPYIVEGLKPQTSYNFRFAASNMVGQGPWGANRVQSTPKRSAPEPPKILHKTEQEDDDDEQIIMSQYSDHFELRWAVPADNGERIDYYQVKYCQGMKVNGEWTEIGDDCITSEQVDTTSYEMSGLSGNTYYRIELRAHNQIGFSLPTNYIMKTARDNPYSSGPSTASHSIWLKYWLLFLLSTSLTTCLTTVYQLVATTTSTSGTSCLSLDASSTTSRASRNDKTTSLSTTPSTHPSIVPKKLFINNKNLLKSNNQNNSENGAKFNNDKSTNGADVVLRVDKSADISSAAIIGIIVGGLIILLIVIDLLCCATLKMGAFATMFRRAKRSPSEIDEETKLGREEKEPLNTPVGSIKKNSSVEFDGKSVYSRSGEIIGKNSAV